MGKQRTAAEQEAEAAKLNAEAAKLNAEAAKALAEAREAAAKATKAELEQEKSAEQYAADRAGDEWHHVYRFVGAVGEVSVREGIKKLTEWHRRDPGCDIEIIFQSPGGEVIAGFALFDHILWLRSQNHTVTTGCTGMAASMAGILMQAGEHRWASPQSWYMIHRAAFGVFGKTYEVEDQVEWVKRIEKRIIDIFVSRSNLTPAKIKRNWERKDFWIDADEALELGLVDEIRA